MRVTNQMARTANTGKEKGVTRRPSKKVVSRKATKGSASELSADITKLVAGINDNETAITESVRSFVAALVRSGGTIAGEVALVIRRIVTDVISQGAEVGASAFVTVKAVTKGVVLGVADAGGDVAKAAASSVQVSVEAASSIGANVGVVASRAFSGLAEAASETGVNAAKLAEAGAMGAVNAASSFTAASGRAVEQSASTFFQGVSSAVRSVLPEFEAVDTSPVVRKASANSQRRRAPERKSTLAPAGRGDKRRSVTKKKASADASRSKRTVTSLIKTRKAAKQSQRLVRRTPEQ